MFFLGERMGASSLAKKKNPNNFNVRGGKKSFQFP